MESQNKITSVGDAINKLDLPEFRKFRKSEVPDYRFGTVYKYPFGIWFRGLADARWKLTPGIFRQGRRTYIEETSMFHVFQLRLSEHRRIHQSTFDWLCLMQHYEMPTRLLDWTENVLIALFFAVNDVRNQHRNGKLCVLNARRLNKHTTHSSRRWRSNICTPTRFDTIARAELAVVRNLEHYSDSLTKMFEASDLTERERNEVSKDLEKWEREAWDWVASPIAVFPSRLNGRMVLQSSMFTVHGGKYLRSNHQKRELPKPRSLEEINDALAPRDQFLKTYLIPGKVKEKIRSELLTLGIHYGSLFPEIDKQAAYIKEQWRFDLPGATNRQVV
jgi:hypothetical protein